MLSVSSGFASVSCPRNLGSRPCAWDCLQRIEPRAPAVAHAGYAAAVVGSAFPHTSLNTLQADALKLLVKKLQSSLAVEGDLSEDGLAVYGLDGDDPLLVLTRQIVSNAAEGTTGRA